MGILGKWSYPMDYLCQCLYGLFGQWSNLWIISLCLTTRIMGQCATTRASTPPSARITDQCPTTRIMGQCVTTSFLTNIHKNYRPMSYHKDHEPTCYYTISIQCPQLLQTNVLFPYNVHNYYRPMSYFHTMSTIITDQCPISIQCPQLLQTNVLFPYNVHNYYRPTSYFHTMSTIITDQNPITKNMSTMDPHLYQDSHSQRSSHEDYEPKYPSQGWWDNCPVMNIIGQCPTMEIMDLGQCLATKLMFAACIPSMYH